MADNLHLRRPTANRRDFDLAAKQFRAQQTLLGRSRTLDADFAAKALTVGGESAGGKRSKKNTTGGLQQDIPEIRFAPRETWEPGKALKLHVTANDMIKGGDEPNWGWVDAHKKRTPQDVAASKKFVKDKMRRKSTIKVRRMPIDPRTGAPIEERVSEWEAKALGRKLSNLVPGGRIGNNPARLAGLIVDANGKFRCPPGTPAANQFTDEFGSNCFSPPGVLREGLDWLAERLGRDRSDGSVFGQRIRRPDPIDQEIDPRKRELLRSRADQIGGTPEDLKRATDEVMQNLANIQAKYGGAGLPQENNLDLFSTLDALAESGDFGDLEWKSLLTSVWGDEFDWDDNATLADNLAAHKEMLRESLFELYDDPDSVRQKYMDGDPEIVERIDHKLRAHDSAMRGSLTAFLAEADQNPEWARMVGRLESHIPFDEDTFSESAYTRPIAVRPGETPQVAVSVNFQQAMLRDYVITRDDAGNIAADIDTSRIGQPGYITLYEAVGPNTDSERMQELQNFFAEHARDERFPVEFGGQLGQDMTAALYGTVESRFQQIMHHEMGHAGQYAVVNNAIIDVASTQGYLDLRDATGQVVRLDGDYTQWTNDEWMAAINQSIKDPRTLPGYEIPPFGMETLEGEMLHLLAGGYYQSFVADFYNSREAGMRPRSAEEQAKVKVMLFEAATEIHALKRMGLLKDDGGVTDWMQGTYSPPTQSPPNRPPGGNPPGDVIDPGPGGGPPRVDPDPDVDRGSKLEADQVASVVNPEEHEARAARSTWERMEKWVQEAQRRDGPHGGPNYRPMDTRRRINEEFAFSRDGEDLAYDLLTGDELEERYDILSEVSQNLIDQYNGEGLTKDQQARLFLALKGMDQILNQITTRELATPEERLKRSQTGYYNEVSGRIKGTIQKRKATLTDPDRVDHQKLKQQIRDFLPLIGTSERITTDTPMDRELGGPWFVGRTPRDGETAIGLDGNRVLYMQRRAFGEKAQKAMESNPVRAAADLNNTREMIDASRNFVTQKVQEALGQTTGRAVSPSESYKDIILPLFQAMDAHPLDMPYGVELEIDEADLSDGIGSTFSLDGFVSGRKIGGFDVGKVDPESDAPSTGKKRVRIAVSKGMRGVHMDENKTEDRASMMLPPGKFEVDQILDDGTIVVKPVMQHDAKTYSRSTERKVRTIGMDMSRAERRELTGLRDAMRDGFASSTGARPQFNTRQSTRSTDFATAQRIGTRNELVRRRAEELGFTPFVVEEIDRSQPAIQSGGQMFSWDAPSWGGGGWGPKTRAQHHERSQQKARSTIAQLRAALADPSSPMYADFADPRMRELFENSTDDELVGIMRDVASSVFRGTDKRIRVALDQTELMKVLNDGEYKTTHDVQGTNGPVVRKVFEASIGIPFDAPTEVRPSHGYIQHAAELRYLERAKNWEPGFSARRRSADLVSHDHASPGSFVNGVFGDIDIVLRPDVSRRSAMTSDDSLRSGNLVSPMDSADPDDHLASFLDTDTDALGLLHAHVTGDEMHAVNPQVGNRLRREGKSFADDDARADTKTGSRYTEALIAGSFDTSEIDHVRIPQTVLTKQNSGKAKFGPAEVGANDESVTSALRAAGLSEEEINQLFNMIYSKAPGMPKEISDVVNVASLIAGAEEVMSSLEPFGVDAVFPNKWGIDIMDVDTLREMRPNMNVPDGNPREVAMAMLRGSIRENAQSIAKSLKASIAPPPPVESVV